MLLFVNNEFAWKMVQKPLKNSVENIQFGSVNWIAKGKVPCVKAINYMMMFWTFRRINIQTRNAIADCTIYLWNKCPENSNHTPLHPRSLGTIGKKRENRRFGHGLASRIMCMAYKLCMWCGECAQCYGNTFAQLSKWIIILNDFVCTHERFIIGWDKS